MILDAVHPEDRTIVQNVVTAIEAIKAEKILTSWEVSVAKGCYVVNAFLRDSADCEFSARELEAVHDISPLRIQSVGICRLNGKLSVRVRVADRDTPLMLTETQIVQVRKRSKWLS
jgi:hypothetical protein